MSLVKTVLPSSLSPTLPPLSRNLGGFTHRQEGGGHDEPQGGMEGGVFNADRAHSSIEGGDVVEGSQDQ
jgi:hypothetical protein